MRLVVTGRGGQLARALAEIAGPRLEVVRVGRPELDLARPGSIRPAIAAARPDVVVNAAAWTAVDLAESEPEAAFAANAAGAGAVAAAAAELGVPVVQISTDYVFPGTSDRPLREDDPTGPLGVYGASKLAGEQAVAAAAPDHAILRTAWVYSYQGGNFLRTMLRLAAARDEVRVVADQTGTPTAADDLARAVAAVAGNLVARPGETAPRGIFHAVSAGGPVSWADFAREIFRRSAAAGGPSAQVADITTLEWPTAATRPARSCLDASRLAAVHGVRLPHWTEGVARAVERIANEGTWA